MATRNNYDEFAHHNDEFDFTEVEHEDKAVAVAEVDEWEAYGI